MQSPFNSNVNKKKIGSSKTKNCIPQSAVNYNVKSTWWLTSYAWSSNNKAPKNGVKSIHQRFVTTPICTCLRSTPVESPGTHLILSEIRKATQGMDSKVTLTSHQWTDQIIVMFSSCTMSKCLNRYISIQPLWHTRVFHMFLLSTSFTKNRQLRVKCYLHFESIASVF